MNPQQKLNKAAELLQSQSYQLAAKHADQILKKLPNSEHALYICAVAHAHLNHQVKSLSAFKQLTQLMPKNSDIHYNHGTTLDLFGLPKEAISAYLQAIKFNPNHLYAHVNLGNIYMQTKQHKLAIDSYAQALAIDPKNAGLHTNIIKALFEIKDYVNCLKQINQLNQLTVKQLDITLLEIQSYFQLGNYRKADTVTLQLIENQPNNAKGHYYHGLCSLKLSRYPVAIEAFEKALKLDSSDINILMNLAICYHYTAQPKAAEEVMASIRSINPHSIDIDCFELKLLEMNNKLFIDTPLLTEALTKEPSNEQLMLLHSQALMASQQHHKAIDVLRQLSTSLDLDIKVEATFLIAGCLDKYAQYDQAWHMYQRANKLLKKPQSDVFNEKLKSLAAQFKTSSPVHPPSKLNEDHRLVFIVGYPRSGTTLIDRILSSQIDCTLLDETPLIADIAEDIIEKNSITHYVDGVVGLTQSEIDSYRDQYFTRINLYQDWPNNQVIIDKSPLNLIHTLLIHKIFPEAPIVFAVRHPLDVCISCFMQNFRANPELMHALSSEQSIAETYHNAMRIWQLINERNDLNSMTVKYENMVSQTEDQIKKLIAFVGFDWKPEYVTSNELKKDRGMIHNPSYSQVNKTIYQHKKYRYLNYAEHLKIFSDKTSEWIDTLGYEMP